MIQIKLREPRVLALARNGGTVSLYPTLGAGPAGVQGPAGPAGISPIPAWLPSTAYAAGQAVLSPTGDVVVAVSSFTSGASYSAANWQLPPRQSNTFAAREDATEAGYALHKVGVVMSPGPSSWDAGLVESLAPVWNESAQRYMGFYTGYNSGVTVAGIGLAWSDDGIEWTKSGAAAILPASGTSGAPDEFGCTGAFPFVEGDTLYLYYIGLDAAGYESGTKRMCLATCSLADLVDGSVTWNRRGTVIPPSGTGWRSTAIWHPCVVRKGSTYYNFFNASGVVGGLNTERIGYATASSPLGPWTVDDTNSPLLDRVAGTWESRQVGDPFVSRTVGGGWVMRYYGVSDGFVAQDGAAVTTDAAFPLEWSKLPQNPILRVGAAGDADSNYAHKGMSLRKPGQHIHLYTAVNGSGFRQIAAAVSPGPGRERNTIATRETTRTVTSTGVGWTTLAESTVMIDLTNKGYPEVRLVVRANPGGRTMSVRTYNVDTTVVLSQVATCTGSAWANFVSPWMVVPVTPSPLVILAIQAQLDAAGTGQVGQVFFEFRWRNRQSL